MKKILTSVIATAALLLGFASCSGDLHDKEYNPINLDGYYLVGSMQGWQATECIKLTTADATNYSVKFTAKSETEEFAIKPNNADWVGQIGGDKMGGAVTSKDNGNGGYNAVLKELTVGSVYKLDFETSTGVILVTSTKEEVPAYYLLDGFYVRGSLTGDWSANPEYLLFDAEKDASNGDCTYVVDFVAIDTYVSFQVARSDWDSGRYGLETEETFALDKEVTLVSGKGENTKVTGLTVGRPYKFVVKTTVEGAVSATVAEVKYTNITAITIKNVPSSVTDGTKIYFLDGNLLGTTDWSATAATTANLSSGSATYTISGGKKMTAKDITCQIVYIKNGESKFGDGWVNVIKLSDGSKNVANSKDFTDKTLVFDVSLNEFSLE